MIKLSNVSLSDIMVCSIIVFKSLKYKLSNAL